jgi:hypothetical protein
MAIKGFTVAKGLVKDDKDMSVGVIGEITQEQVTRQNQTKRGEIDETTANVFVIPVHCESTGEEPITIRLMLGTNINPEPLDTMRKGSKNIKVYNKLTTFLLKTGCLTTSDLENLAGQEQAAFDKFLKLEGIKIRFKSEKNKAGFNDILIGSIEVLTA